MIEVHKFGDKGTEEFSEQWMVRWNQYSPKTGLWQRKEQMYVTRSKNKHKQVEAKWRKDHQGPLYQLIHVEYQ